MTRVLVPPPEFMAEMRALEAAYLAFEDPIRRSGFGGGEERWKAERSPILTAVDRDGDFLDVGCANGYLAASLWQWAAASGILLVPHGIDLGVGLVEKARRRLPEHAANFLAADAWTWQPRRRYRYVYSLEDLAPGGLFEVWVARLASWVEPGGRLIIGSYGSRSEGRPPRPIGELLEAMGRRVGGSATGGDPVVTVFAWVEIS